MHYRNLSLLTITFLQNADEKRGEAMELFSRYLGAGIVFTVKRLCIGICYDRLTTPVNAFYSMKCTYSWHHSLSINPIHEDLRKTR
jgi:hypothetical protein